jgi:hypothetical protein
MQDWDPSNVLRSSPRHSYRQAATTGALAGIAAGTIQVLVGLLIEKLLLPPGEDNEISPRLVDRLLKRAHKPTSPLLDWLLGTVFHFAYGAGWGALYGVARRWSDLPHPFLAAVTGWMIYLAAFSRIGLGTRTKTEQHPRRRPWQKQVSLIAVAWTFAASTAAVYRSLEHRVEGASADSITERA